MFKYYIVVLVVLNLSVSYRPWISMTFEEIRYVWKALHNPCRSDYYRYTNPIFAGVRRNVSTDFRCWMWSMSGTQKNFTFTSDVCQDFQYDSIGSESDLHVPVQFDEGTFMVLYEVKKFNVLMNAQEYSNIYFFCHSYSIITRQMLQWRWRIGRMTHLVLARMLRKTNMFIT